MEDMMKTSVSIWRNINRTGVLCVGACIILWGSTQSFAHDSAHPSSNTLANTSVAQEFYLTFPQNLLDPTVTPYPALTMTCFIASNYNTTGTIQILGPGNTIVWQENFVVDSLNVTEIDLPQKYNLNAEIQDFENQTVLTKAVHIKANKPIVVYGYSYRQYTSDGYLAIPPSSWGTEYRVAGYYGLTTVSETEKQVKATSEFALVSAYDSTIVSIILSANTMDANGNLLNNAGDAVTVTLNKGQVYQVQAQWNVDDPQDLSMSEISSNKPVGLIAGSKCADVPTSNCCCDIILEMITPVATWGTEYFTYPFDPPPDREWGDVWRIYPSQDNTKIYLNGTLQGTVGINSNPPWFEITEQNQPVVLNTAAHWSFSAPVMMVQYVTSEGYDGDLNACTCGDPADAVLETLGEYSTGIVYATPPDSDGFTNYVNVVIDGTGGQQSSLLVDGQPVTALTAPYYVKNKAVAPDTAFWVYHIQIPGGVHRLSAKAKFSAYGIGTGTYNSYAWPCALSLKVLSLDTVPPLLQGQLTCGVLDTSLTDYPSIDSIRSNLAQFADDSNGIGWVHGRYPDSTYNFNDEILADPADYIPGDSTTELNIQVTNLRNPAHGALYAVDKAGNDTTYYFNYIPDSVAVYPYLSDFGKLPNNASKTDTITLVNPYKFGVRIDSLWLQGNSSFSLTGKSVSLPDSLPAGDTILLYVNFSSGNDSTFISDTVMVQFACFSRPLAVVGGGAGKPCVSANNLALGILAISPKTNVVQIDSSVTIYNLGTDTLTITGLKISGPAGNDFTINPMPTFPLYLTPSPNGYVLHIDFSTTLTGAYIDSLIISSDANDACADSTALLTATVVSPGIHPTGYNWGRRLQGCQFFNDSAVTIINDGNSADTLISIKYIGGDSGAFNITPPQLPLPLPANQTQLIPYRFIPNDTGNIFEYIQLVFAQSPPEMDTLQGIGVLPILSSQNINFGTQKIGLSTDSFAVALNVPKQYGDTLIIYAVAIVGGDSADFNLSSPKFTDTLDASNDTVHIMVNFAPTANGARQSNLCIDFNGGAGCADTVICYTLTGTGVAPALTVDNWDAKRVFITTTRQGTIFVHNNGSTAAQVTGLTLSQNTVFKIDPSVAQNFAVQPNNGTYPILLQFTPQDTITYYDTLEVSNNTQDSIVEGYLTGIGKVVIYTALVPNYLHALPGAEFEVPIIIPNEGYTRPSALNPGDLTPLDSGNINSLAMGLSFDRTIMQPVAANTSIFDLTNTIDNGYTASLMPSSQDSTIFTLSGAPILTGDSGIIVNIKYLALYAPKASAPLYDTVSTIPPYVLWQYVPGLFTLDSICGLGPGVNVVYSDVASLGQSSPNPIVAFGNTSANIPFSIAHTTNAFLSVYNSLGREVARLVNTTLGKGSYSAEFSAQDFPAGLYYYRLITNDGALTRAMMIMR